MGITAGSSAGGLEPTVKAEESAKVAGSATEGRYWPRNKNSLSTVL